MSHPCAISLSTKKPFMKTRWLCLTASLGFLLAGVPANGQEKAKAPALVGERAPVLRIEAQGATARVTGLAFGPDGKTLYVGGLDKVARVWTRDLKDQQFEATSAYRVPIGPGVQGALNALALSPD